jgi:mono/diheme cytochrome c family protein
MRAVLGVCLLFLVVIAITAASPAPSPSKLERGKYLVDQVGMCGDCHTPRNEKGEPIKEKYLKGTPLSFKPIAPVPGWADKSPNIAGLPGWEEQDAIKFLMTGLAYNDLPGRPPMPQYRFNKEDAAAIVAYLRSLVPEGKAGGDRK